MELAIQSLGNRNAGPNRHAAWRICSDGRRRPSPGEMTLPAEILAIMADQMAASVQAGGGPPQGNAEAAAVASLPFADIQSLMVSANGSVSVVPKNSPPITSDSMGRFAFTNLAPGTYKLIFAANGYVRQNFGQQGVAGEGIPIVLAAGQAKNDLVMRMSPVSAIGGHIFDRDGRPAVGVQVQLYRFAYDETGQKKTQRAASTQTDDRGAYRMYYLTPGRYYLSAGNAQGQNRPADVSVPPELAAFGLSGYVSSNRVPQDLSVSYFPGVADVNSATAIDVQPGADLSGIDLSLSEQQFHSVRGRVIDSRTGQPPSSASISSTQQYRIRWTIYCLAASSNMVEPTFPTTTLRMEDLSLRMLARDPIRSPRICHLQVHNGSPILQQCRLTKGMHFLPP